MDLELDIDGLVLDGALAANRERFVEVLERELTRLFSEWGVPPSLARGGHIPRLDVGNVDLTTATGDDIAASVARAIFRGLTR